VVHETEFNKLKEPVFKLIQELKPDVVVSDFFFYPGVQAADKLGIPVVINV
jgi:UDP-N-acetylglucosamine:LPS N-acetylglucosamine transferase